MSHEITATDNLFVVREPAWHGLGVVLPDYPTREQAQAIAHPWEPISEPIYRQVITVENDVPVARFEQVEDFQLQARSDNGASLGVTPESRVSITNSEMYDIAEAIEGESYGDVRYETGGSIHGGKKVWLLVALREPLRVPGDPHGEVVPYFMIQNGHSADGGAFRGQSTLVRVVCDNTIQAADADSKARGTEFTFRHTKNVRDRIQQAADALAGWRESVSRYNALAAHLVNMPITVVGRERFLTEFVPSPPAHIVSERVTENIETARGMIRDILASPTCEGIDGTAYGLVQAATEYLQHGRRAHTAESRFKRAYLDRSDLTKYAVELAQQVAV